MYQWVARRVLRPHQPSPELATRLTAPLSARVRALSALSPTLKSAALGAALRAADAEEREVLTTGLIELAALDMGEGGDAALEQIARSWELLTPEARRASLAVGGDRWNDLCRGLLDDPAAAVRARAIALAGHGGLCGLADRVVDHLLSGDEQLAAGAERALLDLTRTSSWGAADAVSHSASLESAIIRAANTYPDHRRRGALLALSALLSSPGALRRPAAALLQDNSGPIAMAMRGVIRKEEDPRFAGLALLWLTAPALEAACRDRLSRFSGDELGELTRRAHLLAHPGRAERVRAIILASTTFRAFFETCDGAPSSPGVRERSRSGGGASVGPSGPDGYAQLRAGVLRLAALAPATMGAGVLASIIADPSAAVRLAGVRVAAGWGDSDEAAACLADLSFDGDANVARAAATALLARRPVRESAGGAARRTLAHLERSAHSEVRATAARFGTAMRLGAGESVGGRLRARRALEEDRATFLERLRAKVKQGSAAERVAAIHLAMKLDVCRDVELELLAVVGGELREGAASEERDEPKPGAANAREVGEAHVVATAVRALGRVGSAASGAAVRACLRHADARVRANAVEAMGPQIGPPVDDAHHRVRGSAVRAALRSAVGVDGVVRDRALAASAGAAISGMLAREDAPMRVSGLWALGCAAGLCAELAMSLAARVEDLSRTDADENVRVRAAALSDRLMRGMRAGWTARAWEGEAMVDPLEVVVRGECIKK